MLRASISSECSPPVVGSLPVKEDITKEEEDKFDGKNFNTKILRMGVCVNVNVFNSENELTFVLKSWNHVCLWQWDVNNDVCAICRTVILEPCLNVS